MLILQLFDFILWVLEKAGKQLAPIAVGLGQWGEEHRCLHNTPHAMRARLTHMRRIAMDPGQRCGPWVTCVSLPSILTMMYT